MKKIDEILKRVDKEHERYKVEKEEKLNHVVDLDINKDEWIKFSSLCEEFGFDTDTVLRIFIKRFIEDPDQKMLNKSIVEGKY